VPPPAPGHAYAGFWRRVAAWLIDSILIAICLVVLSFVGTLFAIIGLASSGQDITTDNLSAVQLVLYLIAFVLAWLYYAGLESSPWQGTVGKRLVRLVVTDRYGRRIGFGRATGRYFAKAGTGMVFLIGGLVVGVVLTTLFGGLAVLVAGPIVLALLAWAILTYVLIILTRRRQSLHDMVAGTLVVRQEHLALITAPPRETPPPAPQQPGASEIQGA
jgi:uncharacterized RDD family membrane protein YckC